MPSQAKIYEGAFHDLLNDLDREVVMADIEGWVNARLPGRLEALPQTLAAS